MLTTGLGGPLALCWPPLHWVPSQMDKAGPQHLSNWYEKGLVASKKQYGHVRYSPLSSLTKFGPQIPATAMGGPLALCWPPPHWILAQMCMAMPPLLSN